MKKIILYEPCISSMNLGDYIIVESIKREMDFLLRDAFVVEQSTQTPLMHFYQKMDDRVRMISVADYKFVCGSNLFWRNMLHPFPSWNINIFTCQGAKGAVMVGVGSNSEKKSLNSYTRYLYKYVLNGEYFHSARDEATKQRLEQLGLKAINTGCPTMWSLNREHCERIPVKKADRVVFTLTDYETDVQADKTLIDILARNYDELYFWPQGFEDYDYLMELNPDKKITIISPNLEAMRRLLCEGNIDYVGTRLHGGIFAMQNYVRSIILMIDNRARDMRDSYNIPAVERANVEEIERLIRSEWKTSINIHEDRIRMWKEQFK